MRKTILLLLLTAFFFSACNKCQECESDSGWANGEDSPYIEVCRDNFDDRNAYEDYIEEMEDNGYDCRSDFWN